MKRTTKIIGLVASIVVVIVFVAFIFLEPYLDLLPKTELDSSLRKSIQNNKGGIVTLTDVTKFHWDRMDIYTPYSVYKDADGKTIEVDEGECLLVFSDKGVTVSLLKFKRFYGDFSDLHREGGYTPSDARFKVVLGKDHWVKLAWAGGGPTKPVER